MAVEVILREDVPNLGDIGDIVRVRPGYARNYLYPRGLAIEASRKNVSELEHQKRVIGVKADRDRKTAEGAAAKLEGLSVTVKARAGEEGRLFGSVTNLDRADAPAKVTRSSAGASSSRSRSSSSAPSRS